ncbi:prenyltransferase/squalene oxidase repeat-containing protein [Prosthecobacter sp.]|uniref:prenyltransferase/squalene oxidase repeat-containing protein n=1 Tax=Prosthecobacter sp. TaxID=1965333 RepID=UPI003783E30B
MLSIAVHVGMLLLAGVILVGTQMTKKEIDFIPAGQTQAGVEASQALEHRVSTKRQTSMAKKQPQTRLAAIGGGGVPIMTDAGDVPLPEAGNGLADGGGKLGTESLGGGMRGTGLPAVVMNLPSTFLGRCSVQNRLEKLRQNGGTPECESAVSQSLAWLKTQQNADGSWGRNNKAAMTGLTLLCYLGRCETPDSPFYGDNVRNGMLYLVELSRKNPQGIVAEQPMSNSATYEHGIATYALGEMYSFYRMGNSSLPGLRDAFEKGVQTIIAEQNKKGAWTYGGKDAGMPSAYNKESGGEDLSVTGWQFQALKAAKHSGLKIAGLDEAIKRCCTYLESKQTKDGGFGVTNRDSHYNQWSLTGCGVLGLQTLARNKATAVKKGIRFLREFLADEPLDWERNCNLYCWYYYTQAFFQAGGDDWRFYNSQFLPQVLGAQLPDGSFKRGRPNWPAGDAADAIYRQCLCTLQLEVYFRYLKVADRGEGSFFER